METCGSLGMAAVSASCLVGGSYHCLCHKTRYQQILQVLTEKLDQPFSISYTPYTLRCVFTFTIAYALGIGIYYSQKRNYRRGVEHGSAKWGDAASICKRYRDKRYTQNLILTQNFRMGLDCYKHKRNLNVLVVGGSGAGKSRAYAVVNIMQCNCSMVITDPKGGARRSSLKRTGTSQLNHCLL